jgi:hypothetical protein
MSTRFLAKWSNAPGPAPSFWTGGNGYQGWVVDASPNDVGALAAAGWTQVNALIGPSLKRPLAVAGTFWLDPFTQSIAVSDGQNWRCPFTGVAV